MKELSIEQKARAYDEALERAKELLEVGLKDTRDKRVILSFFPKLKESGDKKIRKAIYNCVKWFSSGSRFFKDVSQEECLAWLEKQDKHTTDKVEHKFHKGDWIVHHGTENIYQVVAIIDNQYQLKYGDTYTVQKCADVDRCARLWDIAKDAKEGDILVDNLGNICIYKEPSTKLMYHSFCYGNHKWFIDVGGSHKIVGTCPATKEQSNLLFQKMKEAGYKWDAEKKGLKKISQEYPLTPDECIKSSWSEDDEKKLKVIAEELARFISIHKYGTPLSVDDITWLKTLKERIQPKQEWSDEDEKMLQNILECLRNGWKKLPTDILKYESWLKSLRPQNKNTSKEFKDTIREVKTKIAQCNGFNKKNREEVFSLIDSLRPQSTWKPSDEMLEALYRVIPENVMEISEDEMLLDKLYQGLKYGKVLSEK